MKEYAIRNISRCTKDCLCLYVCPTGASDTEDSIIDKSKCIGCGACMRACPSGAISMLPRQLPPQQKVTKAVSDAMIQLANSKLHAEKLADSIQGKLAKAISMSCRIMAEDIVREAGYMLPQSGNSKKLLQDLSDNLPKCSARDAVKVLLDTLDFNE